jgi:hypothetical protein
MSQIGFYRYKISTLDEGNHSIEFQKNGITAGVANVQMRAHCDGDLLIKYLDAKNKYRFFNFSKISKETTQPKEIGSINVYFESLLTSQGDTKSVGFTSSNIIDVVAEQVTDEQLNVLQDIYTSPRVYLRIGTTDEIKSWVLIKVSGDNIVKRAKLNKAKINMKFTLPKNYTITMI